jgi:hypothetical protein
MKTTDEYEVDYRKDNLDTYIKKRRIRIIKIAVILVFLAIVGAFALKIIGIYSGGKAVMREAKDVRIGLRMVAVENYGTSNKVFDPSAANGLGEGIEMTVLAASDADGRINLLSWDDSANEPTAFIYEKDQYIVHFNANSDDDKWKVYYTYKVLSY